MSVPRPRKRPSNPYLPENNPLERIASQREIKRRLGKRLGEGIEKVTNTAVYEGVVIGPWIYGAWEFLNLITPVAYQLVRDYEAGEAVQTSLPVIGWGAVAGPAAIALLPEKWVPITRGGGTLADSTPVQTAAVVGGALAGEKYFKAIADLGGNLAEGIGRPLEMISYGFNQTIQFIPEIIYRIFQDIDFEQGTEFLGYDFIRHFAIPGLLVGAGIHFLKKRIRG